MEFSWISFQYALYETGDMGSLFSRPLGNTFQHFNILITLNSLGRVTHICVSKLNITGSDIGLSPDRRQAIIWTNAGILLIGPLGTHFSEILFEIHIFSLKKMHFKISSGKCRLFCLGPYVLILNMLEYVQMCDSTDKLLPNCNNKWSFNSH